MKYDYYLHRSGGYAFDYFGGIGKPFKVSWFKALVAKLLKREVTPCPVGCSEHRVYVRAVLKRGISRRSYFMSQIKKGIYDRI